MSTARCYTCHTLRPLQDFRYRRRDNFISTTTRLKRCLAVLLLRPGARRSGKDGAGGAVLRYRCIHPLDGTCPESTKDYVAQRRFRPSGIIIDSNVVDVELPRADVRGRSDEERDEEEEVQAGNEIEVASLAESVRDIISILKGEDIPETKSNTTKPTANTSVVSRWKQLSCATS